MGIAFAEMEVNNISGKCASVTRNNWLEVLSQIIQKSSQPMCLKWLEDELYLEGRKHDKALLSVMFEKLKGDGILRFVSVRVDILEDLVLALADGIASIYIELISVDGNLSSEMNSLGLAMCSLSTRSLQRLRNEVALNQWLHQNMESIVLMYEDRFELCTLQVQLLKIIRRRLRNSTG